MCFGKKEILNPGIYSMLNQEVANEMIKFFATLKTLAKREDSLL